MEEAKVLNGTVQAGDTIAYAVRAGSWLDMNIAKVDAIESRVANWSGGTTPVLKITVDTSSRYPNGMKPYKTTIGVLDRVVKL